MTSTERVWKYVFIGAGPANLAAVSSLPLVDQRDSLIIEAGRGGDRRPCPTIRSKTCSNCDQGNCPVVQGVGGSNATLGNKLCHFPASSGVLSLSDVPRSIASGAEIVSNIFRKLRGISDCSTEIHSFPGRVKVKHYEVERLLADDYRTAIGTLLSMATKHARLRTQTRVLEIAQTTPLSFSLTLDNGERIRARSVVLAPGRSGYAQIGSWLGSLGVRYDELSEDVGFRIEVPTDTLNPRFLYQSDPKIKFDFGTLGSARTFCTCVDGLVVPVKLGQGFYADGAFSRGRTGLTNFAVMARTQTTVGGLKLDNWVSRVNSRQGDNLTAGQLRMSGTASDIARGFVSILPDSPTREHHELLSLTLEELFSGQMCPIEASAAKGALATVYAPAVDRFWGRPRLESGFRTSVRGLFVIGDATGVSRGIIQAIESGVTWAHSVCGSRGWDEQINSSTLENGERQRLVN